MKYPAAYYALEKYNKQINPQFSAVDFYYTPCSFISISSRINNLHYKFSKIVFYLCGK